MNQSSHTRLKAFTLVELLVALTIALVLTAVALRGFVRRCSKTWHLVRQLS